MLSSHPVTPSARTPKLNALLICQRIIRETESGLVSPVAIFETLSATRLPVIAQLFLYAKMTDAQGEYEFKVEVVRRNDMAIIAEAPLPSVTIADPTSSSEIILELAGLRFNEAGAYDFRLWANERFLDSKSLGVRIADSQRPAHEVRVVGSAIIGRFTDCMLEQPKPAAPI